MVLRTWLRVLATALGVAVVVGAGQLGLGFGLGIVRLSRVFEPGAENQWTAQLAWVSWFAMVAAIGGAVTAEWAARRLGHQCRLGERVALGVTAAVGAGAVAPLCMQPARAAQLNEAFDPVMIIGLAAGFGAVAGGFAAVAALSLRHALLNAAAVTGLVWAVALISVAPSLGPTDPLPAIRLGVLDISGDPAGTPALLGLLGLPVIALLSSGGVAALARIRGLKPVPIVLSGGLGPGLLAVAYLTAGPGLSSANDHQTAPYWGALIAVGAGLLAAVAAAVLPFPGQPSPVALWDRHDPDRPDHHGSPDHHTGPDEYAVPADRPPWDRPGYGAAGAEPPPAPADRTRYQPPAPDTRSPLSWDGPADGSASARDEPDRPSGSWLEPARPARPAARHEPPETDGAGGTDETAGPGGSATEAVSTEDPAERRSFFRRGRRERRAEQAPEPEPMAPPEPEPVDPPPAPPVPPQRGGARTSRRQEPVPEPITERDAEYVDWVSGLSGDQDTPGRRAATPADRRSLRLDPGEESSADDAPPAGRRRGR